MHRFGRRVGFGGGLRQNRANQLGRQPNKGETIAMSEQEFSRLVLVVL
jgi:hypothetical protein